MFLGNDTAMVTGIQKGLLETICSGPGNLWVLSETTISLRRVPGEALCPLAHTSCLENPMDGGAWWAAVHGGREESDMTECLHFHFNALEKEMATHSSVLAWRIPGKGEPGGLPSMGLHRVGHD